MFWTIEPLEKTARENMTLDTSGAAGGGSADEELVSANANGWRNRSKGIASQKKRMHGYARQLL